MTFIGNWRGFIFTGSLCKSLQRIYISASPLEGADFYDVQPLRCESEKHFTMRLEFRMHIRRLKHTKQKIYWKKLITWNVHQVYCHHSYWSLDHAHLSISAFISTGATFHFFSSSASSSLYCGLGRWKKIIRTFVGICRYEIVLFMICILENYTCFSLFETILKW